MTYSTCSSQHILPGDTANYVFVRSLVCVKQIKKDWVRHIACVRDMHSAWEI
jgi:hypothetical protein